MLFNNDSMVVVSAIFVLGVFSYTFYNIFTTVPNNPIINNGLNNESLVNTIPNYVEAGVQTSNINVEVGVQAVNTNLLDTGVQASNLYVNTGMQTSAGIWYQTVKNWIMEILSMNSSEFQGVSPTDVRVENWINKLESTQLVSTNSAQNSIISGQDLIDPIDSASNIMESAVSSNAIPIPIPDPTSLMVPAPQTSTGNIFLDYANSQTTWDIGTRSEYFNTISPELNVELEVQMHNGIQYMFAVINDVLLTVNPEIFNLFM
jgi:hypothetical protein